MKSYTDLDVWKKSRVLVKTIYDVTDAYSSDEKFGLISQMRRAAVSVPSNIAEGHGRNHTKDSLQFYYISRGSLFELETHMFLSFDLNYINEEALTQVLNELTDCKKLLNGLIRYNKNLTSNN
jgi:four helix bundle protein